VAEELEKAYPQVEVETVPGFGGVFKVIVDGKVIFNKEKTGRFPEKDEIVGVLEENI